MSAISIQLAENPSKIVLAFSPRGGKIRIRVKFPSDNIPEHYRMQIIDSCNNTRLNRYGKGSTEGITLNWPIPTIRAIHHGTWQVKVETDTDSFSEQFYVYPFEFSLFPMLPAGPAVPTAVPVEEKVPAFQIELPVQESIIGKEEITLPVTMIKGIGKTFADRLANYEIHTVTEFVKYPDHTYLGEIMRVSDSRLEKMVENGRSLLKKEPYPDKEVVAAEPSIMADLIMIIDDSPVTNLVDIPGIGPKTASRLARYDINSISEFVNYSDRTYLGEIIRVSDTRLAKMIYNARILLGEEGISEPVAEASSLRVTSLDSDSVDTSLQSLLETPGIGPKTVEKLIKMGITSLDALLKYENVNVLRKTLRMSQNRFNNFISTIDKSKRKTGEQEPVKTDEKVILQAKQVLSRSLIDIKGIGLKTAEKMKTAGIKSVDDLIKADLGKLSRKTKIPVKRLETWQNDALTSRN